jgi:serine/threonine protein kinase
MIQWILWNILKGAEYLNELGFAHGDLKAGNVFLRDSSVSIAFPDVHIGDFGSVVQGIHHPTHDFLLLPSGVTTTLQYCAPEMLIESSRRSKQIPHLPGLTSQIDVWSIGCILAEWYLQTMLFPCPFTEHDYPSLPFSQRKQFRYLWKALGPSFFVPRSTTPSRSTLALQTAYQSCVLYETSLEQPRPLSGDDELLPKPLTTTMMSDSSSSFKSTLSKLLFELHQTDSLAEDLLCHMLAPFPEERWTISKCLEHAWFDPVRSYFTTKSTTVTYGSSVTSSSSSSSSSSMDVTMSDSPC